MKIAFINIYQGLIERGAEVSLAYLANYLSQRHQVTFFQIGKEKKPRKYSIRQIKLDSKTDCHKPESLWGKILERFYLTKRELKILYFSLKILPDLIGKEFDILIPTNGFWQVLVCKLVRLIKGSKIVIIGWAGIGFHDQHNLKLSPDIFVALTQYAQKWAKGIKPGANIVYIPNSVDCQFYHPQKKPLIKKRLPIILCVAALTKYKRIDLIIKAVAKMKTKCFLLIAGQGELKSYLQKMGKKLLGKNFCIKNFPHQLMPQVYNSCQVFTLASAHQDAFPRVMLEALSCARTVVASDNPIKKEVIGEAGLFVDPQDTSEYAKVLEKALKLDYQIKARKQAEQYDIKKVGQKFENMLLNLK